MLHVAQCPIWTFNRTNAFPEVSNQFTISMCCKYSRQKVCVKYSTHTTGTQKPLSRQGKRIYRLTLEPCLKTKKNAQNRPENERSWAFLRFRWQNASGKYNRGAKSGGACSCQEWAKSERKNGHSSWTNATESPTTSFADVDLHFIWMRTYCCGSEWAFMPQKTLYSEYECGMLVAGQQPFLLPARAAGLPRS